MKQTIHKIRHKAAVRQLVKYGMVGLVGLVIDMGIYYLLVKRLEVHYPFSSSIVGWINSLLEFLNSWGVERKMSVQMIDILISNIISSTLAVINNFILNSYFTFRVTDNKMKRFASFAGIASCGLVISSILLILLIDVMGINELVAKMLSIVIVAMFQFVVNKLVTFKQR